jgi:hypothetical protein
MPSKHNEAVLRVMAEEHITYEIERLVMTLPIQAQVAAFMHPIVTQSLLEAFLVHLRALADFVAAPRRPRHELDVAAEDYYDGDWADQPDAIFGADVEEHQQCMDELHRRLAHISVQRADSEDFIWSHAVNDWRPALIDALRRFIGGLPPDRQAWFARANAILAA